MKRFIPIGILIAAAACSIAGQTESRWESPAKLHRFLEKPVAGTLAIDAGGVEFRSEKLSRQWRFIEIHTFDVSDRDLTLTIYQNRRWHQPGERQFHFTLETEVPPAVAAVLKERVHRPARNGVPDARAVAVAEIPARHSTTFGGSNGVLRFRDIGIDYVTPDGRDSRSWLWSDIQTIANPDPFALRVTAYREIATFELKEPLPRELFDRLWDRMYTRDLNISSTNGGTR